MAQGRDVGNGLGLLLKGRIREGGGVGGLTHLGASGGLGDHAAGVRSLDILVVGVAGTDPGGRHGAVVLGPSVGGLAPVVAQGGDVGNRLGTGSKSRVREDGRIGGLAQVGAGGRRGDSAGGLCRLGLHVSRVVGADPSGRDLAVVVRPGVGGRGPIMLANADFHVCAGHGEAVAVVAVVGEGSAAGQEEVLRVGRIASRVVGQDGDGFALRRPQGVVVEQAGGQGVELGHVVGCAACAGQGHVGFRCDGIAAAALVVGIRHQVVAVGQGALGAALPAVEVLRAGPFPSRGRKDAVPDGENASAVPHKAAAEGCILPQEAAVYRTAGDGNCAGRVGIADHAAVGAVAVDLGVDRQADAAVVEAADPVGIRQNARREFLRSGDFPVHVKAAEDGVLGVPEGGAVFRGIGGVEGQGMPAAVIDAPEAAAACACHVLVSDGKVVGLQEAHADAGVAAVHIGLHLLPIRPGADQIGVIRGAVAGQVRGHAGRRQVKIGQRYNGPRPGAVRPVNPHLIVSVPVGKPALLRGLAQRVGGEDALGEQIGRRLLVGFQCIGTLEEGSGGEASGGGNGVAASVHKAQMGPRQAGSPGDGADAEHVIEPIHAEAGLGAVVGEVRRADAVGAVGGEGVVEAPQALVQLDQSRGGGLGQDLIVEAYVLDAGPVHNVAGHGNALALEDRGGLREAAVPEDLRRVGIGVRDGVRLVLGHVAVDLRSLLRRDCHSVLEAALVALVILGEAVLDRGGLARIRLCGGHVEHVGGHGHLAHEVQGDGVGHGLKGEVRAVLVAEAEVVVHGDFSGFVAGPAQVHALVQEQPAGVGGCRSGQVGQIAVRVMEGKGSVVLVDVDAVRHGADLIGDGDDGVGGGVLDLQNAGGYFPVFQHLLGSAVGGRHDDLTVRVVIADAHAGGPALGAVGDLRQDKFGICGGALEADRKGQRGAERSADPGGHMEEGLMLQGLLRPVVGVVVLVVRGAVQTSVVIRAVRFGVDFRPQMQAAELLQADEAGSRNDQFPGHAAAMAAIQACVFSALQRIDSVLVINLIGSAAKLLGRRRQLAAGNVHGQVLGKAVIVLLPGVVGKLEIDVFRVGVAGVEDGGLQIQLGCSGRLVHGPQLRPEIRQAEFRLGFYGKQVRDGVGEGVCAKVIRILPDLHPEGRTGRKGFYQLLRPETQFDCTARRNGFGQLPCSKIVVICPGIHLHTDGNGIVLAAADGSGAGIGKAEPANQPLAEREVILCKRQFSLSKCLIAYAEGNGIEAKRGVAVRRNGVNRSSAGQGKRLTPQLLHAAIGQYQELLALGAVIVCNGSGRHLQIGEGQAVHGAGISGGGVLLAQVGLFQFLGLHIILDAVLVNLQMAHGEDCRAAPSADVAIPPRGVDRVGKAAWNC